MEFKFTPVAVLFDWWGAIDGGLVEEEAAVIVELGPNWLEVAFGVHLGVVPEKAW